MSLPEIDLMHYQREQDRAYAADCWVANKSDELMMDECNPHKPENFVFAIDSLNQEAMEELADILKTGDATRLGKFLLGAVEDYWIQESESIAEDILFSKGEWQ